MRHLLLPIALTALLPTMAHAADRDRGLYLSAGGTMRFLPALDDWVDRGRGSVVEFGWRQAPFSAGLLLAASTHNVTHYEIQGENDDAPKIGGDVFAWRAGAVGRFRPVAGDVVALSLRAEAGASGWNAAIDEQAWDEFVAYTLGPDAQRSATGFWAAVGPGLDLTLPILEEGNAQPRAIFEVLGGWQQAGNLSGPQIDLRMTLVAPL
ncbi:MAG: hypothetical protein ABIO70_17480 [Pseudomonadota bacterium]